LGLNPGVAIRVLNDLVRDLLDVALDLRVLVLAANETLGGEESVLRVDDSLTLGGDTNKPLAVGSEANDGRSGARAWLELVSTVNGIWRRTFRVFDDARLLAFHDGHGRVGGAQVDADDSALDLFIRVVPRE
jgi:hypothetical protein